MIKNMISVLTQLLRSPEDQSPDAPFEAGAVVGMYYRNQQAYADTFALAEYALHTIAIKVSDVDISEELDCIHDAIACGQSLLG